MGEKTQVIKNIANRFYKRIVRRVVWSFDAVSAPHLLHDDGRPNNELWKKIIFVPWMISFVASLFMLMVDAGNNPPPHTNVLLWCLGGMLWPLPIIALFALWTKFKEEQFRLRHKENRCKWCGYNLTGIDINATCPECGKCRQWFNCYCHHPLLTNYKD